MIRNSFTKKSVGTLTLGERLRKLRSEKRIALNEVSRITKIQVAYLEYLEEGIYEKLPADVYVKGFLRSYADFLGINEQIFIKLYEKEKGIRKNVEESKYPQTKKANSKSINISAFVVTPQKLAVYLITVLIFVGVVYLYREMGSFSDAPRLIVLNPAADARIENNSLSVEGMTEKDAKLFINNQPILVNDDGKFKENLTLQKGVNTINLKAINKFGKETEKAVTIQSDQADENLKGDENQENAKDGLDRESKNGISDEIKLELKVDPGPVWLSVEADGNLVFSGTMLSGAIQSFNANDKIVVSSGRANATYVKFNGKDIGTLGQDQGAVRGVTFNKDTKY
jgi:cytoskeletal protein RodZ